MQGDGGGACTYLWCCGSCDAASSSVSCCRTVAKAVPAIIFLVTAAQMISDNVPWWPGRTRANTPEWTATRDIWNSTADEIDAQMSKSFSAPSDAVNVR